MIGSFWRLWGENHPFPLCQFLVIDYNPCSLAWICIIPISTLIVSSLFSLSLSSHLLVRTLVLDSGPRRVSSPNPYIQVRSYCGVNCSCSVTQLCPTLCNPMDCFTPGFLFLQYFPELAQTHTHWVDDVIQPFHLLLSPSLPALNISQH